VKLCRRCDTLKPKAMFSKRTDRPNGLQSRCNACAREIHNEWRLLNKARRAADMAAWRAKNPGKSSVWRKRWQQNNLAVCRAANARRHAAKLRAVPPWAEAEKIALVYSKARQLGLEVDHVVPLQHPLVCGLHVWANLQLLHESENARKKNNYWPDMP
jgi:hypothetical protein